MAMDVQLVSRVVECPGCRAEAILTYTRADEDCTVRHEHKMVYVCPNTCALQPHQVNALIGHDRG